MTEVAFSSFQQVQVSSSTGSESSALLGSVYLQQTYMCQVLQGLKLRYAGISDTYAFCVDCSLGVCFGRLPVNVDAASIERATTEQH